MKEDVVIKKNKQNKKKNPTKYPETPPSRLGPISVYLGGCRLAGEPAI